MQAAGLECRLDAISYSAAASLLSTICVVAVVAAFTGPTSWAEHDTLGRVRSRWAGLGRGGHGPAEALRPQQANRF